MAADHLYLPFTATWKKVGPRPAATDGVDGTLVQSEVEIALFAEPLAPGIAESKYGVMGISEPHHCFVDPEVCDDIIAGDVISWNDRMFVVEQVRHFRFDPPTTELTIGVRVRGRL